MSKETKEKKTKTDIITDVSEITDEVLSEVIMLARLDPSTPGMPLQKQHLRKILEYFKILRDVSLEGLDPTIQINPTPIPLREDEVGESFNQKTALANAKNRVGEFFIAPHILGNEESSES